MTSANKKAFEKWYAIENLKEFDFKKEFEDYCRSDVQLLTEGKF